MAADRIVVLDDGRVVEEGTYDELVAAEGHFARLCRLQEDPARVVAAASRITVGRQSHLHGTGFEAGHQAGFDQDLATVADAEDRLPLDRGRVQHIQQRILGGYGSSPHPILVGKPAGYQEAVELRLKGKLAHSNMLFERCRTMASAVDLEDAAVNLKLSHDEARDELDDV